MGTDSQLMLLVICQLQFMA